MPFHTCPICRKRFPYKKIENSPDFPFCSRRCKLVDLGRWLEGEYVLPGSEEEDSEKPDADKDKEEE